MRNICLLVKLFCLMDSRSHIIFGSAVHMEPYVYQLFFLTKLITFFRQIAGQINLPSTALLIKNEWQPTPGLGGVSQSKV